MKSLYVLLIMIMIGSGYGLTHENSHYTTASPLKYQADEPGTGNDGEDTTERGFMCRLFNVFCSAN
ncbi:hypothetical protein [Kangiella sp. M94]